MSSLIVEEKLAQDIRSLINSTKSRVAISVNSQMTMLYWHIGKRIKEEIIKSERAEYGAKVIKLLAQDLSAEYGKGFSRFALSRMVQFYDQFQDNQIVATLSQQLTWSHMVELLPVKIAQERQFYAYMTIESGWSVILSCYLNISMLCFSGV